jgi:hypothetical protein
MSIDLIAEDARLFVSALILLGVAFAGGCVGSLAAVFIGRIVNRR